MLHFEKNFLHLSLYSIKNPISSILLEFLINIFFHGLLFWRWCYMFKDKIKFLRKHQELSQEELAKEIGVLQSTYSRYEQGTREPDFVTLKKLANFFDVSIDYLLENDSNLSDSDEIVDLNNFLINGRYTIFSKFPTEHDRKVINAFINAVYNT